MGTDRSIGLPAIELRQHGYRLYVCGMNASQMNAIDFHHYNPELPPDAENQGYQRGLTTSRIGKIATLLLGKADIPALMPTAIVCNARNANALSFKDGILTIVGSIEAIDGQHRHAGMKRALEISLKDDNGRFNDVMQLPVVIISGLDTATERREFVRINREARKVKTDLAYANNHAYYKEKGYPNRQTQFHEFKEAVATNLTILLNEDRKSVFRNKIIQPDTKAGNKAGRWINFGMMISSLKNVVNFFFEAGELPENLSVPACAERIFVTVNSYWAALQKLMPDCFIHREEHVLLISSASGVPATNGFLARMLHKIHEESKPIDKINFERMLSSHPSLSNSSLWSRDGGDREINMAVGGKGSDFLIKRFLAELDRKKTVKIRR